MTARNGNGLHADGSPSSEGSPVFRTDLGQGPDGFLASMIVQGLALGERTAEDFIRHFSPRYIMSVLPAKLRADILIGAGVLGDRMRKMAEKKSPDSAGEDLQMALDEGGTDAVTIVAAFPPDARVTHLMQRKLWVYATESAFWKREAPELDSNKSGQAYMAFILQSALDNGLLFPKQVVDALTMARLAEDLPKAQLGAIIAAALADDEKFSESTLLNAVPPTVLVQYVSLTYLWERVVEPLVAQVVGFMDPPQPALIDEPSAVETGDERPKA